MGIDTPLRSAGAELLAHAADMARYLELLHHGELFEVRALKTPRRGTVSGYYSDPHAAARDVMRSLECSGAEGVYVTLNALNPAVVARSAGRLRDRATSTTADADIQHRRWLLLDFDARRPSGVSATDAEEQAALDLAERVRDDLASTGWPEPLLIASGNGAHLLYRIALPNDPASRSLVERVLTGLAARYDGDCVHLDTSTYNAARITKLVGTVARKGDNAADRPHRRAHMLDAPDGLPQIVATELLEAVATPVQARDMPRREGLRSDTRSGSAGGSSKHVDDLRAWLDEHRVRYREKPGEDGARVYVLEQCMWADHANPWKAWAAQYPNGRIAAGCRAEKCQSLGFNDLRDKLEPGWRDQQRQNQHQEQAQPSQESSEPDPSDSASTPDTKSDGEGRGPSIASQLIALALTPDGGADLWHDADGDAWATYRVASHDDVPEHAETSRLNERGFRRWLAARLYMAIHKQPSAQALQDALLTLEGVAVNERPRRVVATRLASEPTLADVIYLDLADDAWRVVRIAADGWRVLAPSDVAALPIRFRRPRGMEPLPMPVRGGSLDALRPFVNVGDDDAGVSAWRLIIAWLVAALRPIGPYPVLSLTGEQGAAKTTLARLLRALIDPNRAPMRRAPRDERDLMIAATNSWAVTLDNLSSLPTWLSDALCVLSTGGGFATRALYENDAEAIFAAQRPVILTGIEEAATRGDLIDRALLITLQAIPDEQRMTEAALWRRFEAARPAILGALLEVVAGALHDLPSVHLAGHPRMADFAEWATAAEGALGRAGGWERGAFMRAYQANRRDANEIALDASPVAEALLALLDDATAAPDRRWKGTASDLLAALAQRTSEQGMQSSTWPKSPRGLAGALTRLAPNLRRAGVTIEHKKEGNKKTRMLYLTAAPRPEPRPDGPASGADDDVREREYTQPSASSASSARPGTRSANSDEIGDAACDAASDVRTVVRTISSDDATTVRRPSADRPQVEVRNHADSRACADDADDADGILHIPSLASSPCARPTNCARRTLANGRTACGLCDARHPLPSQPSSPLAAAQATTQNWS